ncbi:hemerythrin domain-containing protein [Microlunatus sp. GCM10028923]|uniref:hemerythrin domain-containing protein n=1 Tax=Microlunatus sp. GCM10028923 TaxID=3273400 RepID=UPI00361A8423
MKPDPQRPADTTMMGVVHDAFRRDLARARTALTTEPYPDVEQRKAIAEHLLWMMRFLHAHHTSEDEGLWPMVLRRNPGAAAIMATMDADHSRIAPAMDALNAAATGYADDGSAAARNSVLSALDTLCEVVLPHLRREEDEAMPVVSASITAAEWDAWDEEHNIKPKPFTQLGPEAHWVIDNLDPERYQVVRGLLPTVPRFIVLNGFRGGYRRRATATWGPGRYGPKA